MKADINTIASACSVSKTTVSKVFTQKSGVSDEMRRKIIATARRLNYSPKQVIAQDTIAIVVSKCAFGEGNSFRSMLLASVMNKLTDSGYLLKIVTSEDLKYMVHSYTRLAILLASGDEAEHTVKKLREMQIPTIAVNGVFDGCHAICSDHAQSVELSVDYLVKNGHKKISLMLDSIHGWGGAERIKGYEIAMKRHELELLPYCSCDNSTTVVECLHQVINNEATALIIEGESIVDEAVYMLNVLGVDIPQDLSIISSEISRRSRWYMPPHTTTNQDIDYMAKKTSEMIRSILDNGNANPSIVMLPSLLIERKSVKKVSR